MRISKNLQNQASEEYNKDIAFPRFRVEALLLDSGKYILRELVDIHIKGNPFQIHTAVVTDFHRMRWPAHYAGFRHGMTFWQRWRLRKLVPVFFKIDVAEMWINYERWIMERPHKMADMVPYSHHPENIDEYRARLNSDLRNSLDAWEQKDAT